jgi:GT2 family glycosyltransferase
MIGCLYPRSPDAPCVVTICRNPGTTIDRTATSIATQTTPLHWIVIDGVSNDGTPDRLRGLPRPPDVLISEPDRGIADAFNKGLALTGERAVLFLNAGDAFADPTVLTDLVGSWDRQHHRWIAGGILVQAADGQPLGVRQPPLGGNPRALVARGNRIPHPAVLADATLLRAVGGFDPTYRYAMDYDLWLRLVAAGHAPQVVARTVATFTLGGVSGDIRGRLREDRQARCRHGLSDGLAAEAWLTLGAWARILAAPMLRQPWAYRLNRALGW